MGVCVFMYAYVYVCVCMYVCMYVCELLFGALFSARRTVCRLNIPYRTQSNHLFQLTAASILMILAFSFSYFASCYIILIRW